MTPWLAVFVLAASTSGAPLSLSAPALCSSAPAPVELGDRDGGIGLNAVCTADCGLYAPVSCSGSTCNAVNRNCPGEAGHVTCGTTTTYCPVCCTDGQIKIVYVGPNCACEDGRSTPKDRYLCVNGEWEFQYSFCGGPFCQG